MVRPRTATRLPAVIVESAAGEHGPRARPPRRSWRRYKHPPGARRALISRRGDHRLSACATASAACSRPRTSSASASHRRRAPGGRGRRAGGALGLSPRKGRSTRPGTLSGNPLAMAAGAAAFDLLGWQGRPYAWMKSRATSENGLAAAVRPPRRRRLGVRVGSLMTLFFAPAPPRDSAEARRSTPPPSAASTARCSERGHHAAAITVRNMVRLRRAHGEDEIDATVNAAATPCTRR